MTNTKPVEDDDRGNESKATGATGGGSFGNLQGAPETGGAPEHGERGKGDVHPRDASEAGDRATGRNRKDGEK